ncbi:Sodium/calcium exchanger protein-domain-containing protein [Clohesyomyces aquaticus]|uniref:Sodium/calcium exchanger protein-domain-containing protein n=1 Tax=Clohesyomyces aquaticus TaxID=1231657 RepID=A0A1Y1YW19_9PLEO|nr:Sodium/calcium exchanger protein-domain-containing protein [Clohesyomyces aquaticus]
MGEPDDPSLFRSVKSKAKALGLARRDKHSQDPVLPTHTGTSINAGSPTRATAPFNTLSEKQDGIYNASQSRDRAANRNNVADNTSTYPPPPAPPPLNTEAAGETAAPVEPEPKPPMTTRMKNGIFRFGNHTKDALLYSWINVLLIFVPIGIAVHIAGLPPTIVFSMNAIAIIPLAGLLSHATEAVAVRLGDTLGALLNVSFGNAVELILFIILLAGNQIRVVQAALLGSILANLLLILGMAFLLGGLRYQEQIYNSTVTQMSACMLSLAVMSLLLPTAFHSAFSSYSTADLQTLRVSRGTSVILLVVYALYLLFQLKSHAYMYASTPQHIIDEESHPGVLADILNSSSSSDSSSDSSSSDSDSSDGSHTTAKRIKRAFRNRKRRKSSASSKDTPSAPSVMSSPSVEKHNNYFEMRNNADNENAVSSTPMSRRESFLGAILSGDEADTDERAHAPQVRDFEAGSSISPPVGRREKRKAKHSKKKHRKHGRQDIDEKDDNPPRATSHGENDAPRVAFADEVQGTTVPKRPFAIRPALPSLLSHNVFNNPQNPPPTTVSPALSNIRMACPRALRRTTSLPDRINRVGSQQNYANLPAISRHATPTVAQPEAAEQEIQGMSRTAAIMMLILSTGLVAVCADFMSDAIEPMVEKTNVSQAFIGLIILPIVGNAAEHVTAVTVATKNKMDLAIGVAVGSSIQIAIFVTPFIVILGWIMGKEMSLYFNIFETVSLFVTAFVVNFLVLDGRSNYLEGSLLIAAYIIIAVASFFYPDGCDASQIGGQEGKC